MASFVIPLILGLAPEVVKLIVARAHKSAITAEAALGPDTGALKFGQVFGEVMTSLNDAANAGQIPKALPADEAVKLIIESVVNSMKLSGALPGPGTTVPAASQTGQLSLKPGQTLTITLS